MCVFVCVCVCINTMTDLKMCCSSYPMVLSVNNFMTLIYIYNIVCMCVCVVYVEFVCMFTCKCVCILNCPRPLTT
jgi:hypothetical protein